MNRSPPGINPGLLLVGSVGVRTGCLNLGFEFSRLVRFPRLRVCVCVSELPGIKPSSKDERVLARDTAPVAPKAPAGLSPPETGRRVLVSGFFRFGGLFRFVSCCFLFPSTFE